MTIEEKAKAYDKALQTAEMYYKGDKGFTADMLPIILPELTESEDERIRRGIIQTLDFACAHKLVDFENVQKMEAYLERQKEQESRVDACGFPLRENEESACAYLERCLAPDMRHVWYEACAEIKEKQKEQKPVEWSEEDEKILNCIIEDIVDQIDDVSNDEGERQLLEKEVRLLKSLRPQPHWKPSEGQMKALKTSISYWQGLINEVLNTNELESLYNDLKKL